MESKMIWQYLVMLTAQKLSETASSVNNYLFHLQTNKNTSVLGHLHKVSLTGNYFGKCIFQKWDSLQQTLWLSSEWGHQFCLFISFIVIKYFSCMYANVGVFNSKVISNLETMSVQSRIVSSAPLSNAYYLGRGCHLKDGFYSLQVKCFSVTNFH